MQLGDHQTMSMNYTSILYVVTVSKLDVKVSVNCFTVYILLMVFLEI